eukprot:CAMPEP_0194735420 /NCGR_PEP_ID=MMETSP0296-20130528/73480_1 /TAXON_ID=39354 /ORGANISM="Heterosigma akashiwo, Strain CCMP2393" /LENGTH=110 /DNA_ID=CAMNT_0039644609 /DNA_START=195 /DNA_END=524 /DNA_ORIENTATION=-
MGGKSTSLASFMASMDSKSERALAQRGFSASPIRPAGRHEKRNLSAVEDIETKDNGDEKPGRVRRSNSFHSARQWLCKKEGCEKPATVTGHCERHSSRRQLQGIERLKAQ